MTLDEKQINRLKNYLQTIYEDCKNIRRDYVTEDSYESFYTKFIEIQSFISKLNTDDNELNELFKHFPELPKPTSLLIKTNHVYCIMTGLLQPYIGLLIVIATSPLTIPLLIYRQYYIRKLLQDFDIIQNTSTKISFMLNQDINRKIIYTAGNTNLKINKPIKITIDSNLINLKQKLESVNKLEELHGKGIIQIVGAEKLYEEMRNHKPEAFDKAKKYENIGEPFVVGYSRIGHAYIASDNKTLPTFRELAEILFPNIEMEKLNDNQAFDVMHLIAHAHSDSKYFITDNTKDFLNGKKSNQNRDQDLSNQTREKLKRKSIIVMTSKEAVEQFDK